MQPGGLHLVKSKKNSGNSFLEKVELLSFWVLPITVAVILLAFLYSRTACLDTTLHMGKGVVLVSDYELLIIVLTIIGLILIERKQKR